MCAERLIELLRQGVPLRSAAEMVAASMSRIREEDIPFTAFSAARILPDGYFTVYTYKAPEPVFMQDGLAVLLSGKAYSAGYEVINEFTGRFTENEKLFLFTDGVTQSGMGYEHGLGIGSRGVADYINRQIKSISEPGKLPESIADYCASLSDGKYEDDTSLVMLGCREANELTLFTGPPGIKSADKKYAELVLAAKGKKVVCGSTTLDIISRELGIPVEVKNLSRSGAPPEYSLEGIDLASEGAITLNQVCNIIDEPEIWDDDNVVVRLCQLLLEADVIHLIIGTAVNTAHQAQVFKQVGVKVRKSAVNMLTDKLCGMGKLVIKKYY
jgi:hypothetical protein